MQKIAINVLGTVIAAGILANISIGYSFGQRLARIEAKLENIERGYSASYNNKIASTSTPHE